MGIVYAEITLVNSTDRVLAKRKQIAENEVKRMNVQALVNTGAYMLTITDSIKRQLDLEPMEIQEVELADGSHVECEIVGPVDVHFRTRCTSCRAVVLPGTTEVLLGAIPIEDMDVMIDLKNQERTLPAERPYIARTKIKSCLALSRLQW